MLFLSDLIVLTYQIVQSENQNLVDKILNYYENDGVVNKKIF